MVIYSNLLNDMQTLQVVQQLMKYGHVGMEGSEVTSWSAREPSRVLTHSCILVVTFSHQSINQFNI